MLLFTLKRLGAGLVLLFVVSIATFFLAHFAISDPTAALLGTSATPAQQAALAEKIGIDQPILVQFWNWFSGVLHGDFGFSWRNFQPVGEQLALKVPVTLSVVTFATLIIAVVGTLFGVTAGLNPGGWFDRVTKAISVVLFALPGFWVSLVLITWFAIDLMWFPAVGYIPIDQSFTGWLRSITLHLLRNSSPAALTTLALMFVGLLSGSVVVEGIFSLPGLGQLTNQSSQNGDIPMLLGITVISVVFVVIVNLALDLVLAWLNPKARVQ